MSPLILFYSILFFFLSLLFFFFIPLSLAVQKPTKLLIYTNTMRRIIASTSFLQLIQCLLLTKLLPFNLLSLSLSLSLLRLSLISYFTRLSNYQTPALQLCLPNSNKHTNSLDMNILLSHFQVHESSLCVSNGTENLTVCLRPVSRKTFRIKGHISG